MNYGDCYRPHPVNAVVVREPTEREKAEQVENAHWWAEQPARIAARLAEAS